MQREYPKIVARAKREKAEDDLARKARRANPVEGQHELFGFLTTEANAEVGATHPKALPVSLTTQEEIEQWMAAPTEQALELQRPLPDGTLKIVMTGEKEDPVT